MNTRKIFLLSGIAVLSAVCVLQTLLARRNPVELVKLSAADAPDSISIVRADGSSVALAKSGDAWTIGDKKYPADPAKVGEIVSALSSIKILGTVSGSSDYERYGLGEGSRVAVTASKAGKTIRTIAAGKNSVTATQSYALVDGRKNVALVSGSLKEVFDRGVDSLRKLEIWSVPEAGIIRIDATSNGKNMTFSLAKAGTPAAWHLAAPEAAKSFAVSADKANAWVSNFAAIRADSFAPEGTAVSGNPVAAFKIMSGEKEISFAIVSKVEGSKPAAANAGATKAGQPAGGSAGAAAFSAAPANGKYLCTSSESPYPFYIKEEAGAKLLAPYTGLGK